MVAESADVEIYKNFIREQDARMNQFVEANNLLKVDPLDFLKKNQKYFLFLIFVARWR